MAAHHRVESEGAGQRTFADLVEDHVAGVRQQHAQELPRVPGAEAAQIEAEFRETPEVAPVRALQLRRRFQQLAGQHAGEADEARMQGGKGFGVGVRAAVGKAGLAARDRHVAAVLGQGDGGQVAAREGEAVGLEIEPRLDLRVPGVQQMRIARRVEAGCDVVSGGGAAQGGALLQDQHLAAGLRQHAGGGQAVVAGTDDDGVEAAHAARSARLLPGAFMPRSRSTSRAALAPGAAMTPPPGWLEEPQR